jgi:PAS domain S-box-containing protein
MSGFIYGEHMLKTPTYEDLEKNNKKLQKRILDLEQEVLRLRQIEDRLTESEEKFRTLFEHSSFVIHIVDVETGNPILQNKRFRDLMGYTIEEMLNNTPPSEEVKPPPRCEIFQHFQHIIKNGPAVFERTFATKEGETKTFLTSAVPLKIRNKWYIQNISFDITEHKQTIANLKDRERELEELNSALKVLLKRRDEEKKEFEENFIADLDELIEPYIFDLKNSTLNSKQSACINTLEINLNQMKSPFTRRLSFKHFGFSHKELKIATLIRDGKTTKEISETLALSIRAIESHRANIRRKLGIQNKKSNLRDLLISYQK